MGSSRALSRACISQRGGSMLPRGPAKAAASAHRDPRARVAARAITAVAPSFAAVEVEALASRLGGYPANPRASACSGSVRRFLTSAEDGSGAGPVYAHFPGTAEGCPSRRHGPPGPGGKALWGALCLSCGTSPERIAPESLTRSLSDFVHGHISWRSALLPPNRVRGLTRLPSRRLRLVNASLARRNSWGWAVAPGEPRHIEPLSLGLRGGLARLGARDELRR